jgi:hypothetical protein
MLQMHVVGGHVLSDYNLVLPSRVDGLGLGIKDVILGLFGVVVPGPAAVLIALWY